MENQNENQVCIQVTCKFSCDNKERYGFIDLMNEDSKKQLENFSNQFTYSEHENIDKIFREVFEEQSLSKLYVDGFDVTVVKYGKRNIFYETDENSLNKTDQSS